MWPPSPSVEEEATSLAKEYGLGLASDDLKVDYPPADSRGAVDQYPIILDNNDEVKHTPCKQKEVKPRKTLPNDVPSSDESSGPPTPPRQYATGRHAYVPAGKIEPVYNSPQDIKPRSKSTSRAELGTGSRGRPQVSRIQTDIGSDLQGMITGQRRAPSPYSYKSATIPAEVSYIKDKTKSSTLSPTVIGSSTGETRPQRARSAHPDHRVSFMEPKNEDGMSTHRPRSKSPVDRKRAHHSSGEENGSKSQIRRPKHDRSPPQERYSAKDYRAATDTMTPPATPSEHKRSSHTLSMEETNRHRAQKSEHHGRRTSKDSPYTSSTEDAYKQKFTENHQGVRSRRNSASRSNKPQIDLSDVPRPYATDKTRDRAEESSYQGRQERFHHALETPLSARTPKSMEDYFEHALEENRKRHARQGSRSTGTASPYASPPASPPRTPRVEKRPHDYFDGLNNVPKPRSRHPSVDENQHVDFKPTTSLLGAATLGASLAKGIPSLSRSSTASLETPPSGSQSKPASGQRSRRPSPVSEESISADCREKDSRSPSQRPPLQRPSESIPNGSRPVSRAGSITGADDFTLNRASTFPVREDRSSSRPGSKPGSRPGSRDGTFVPLITVHEQTRPLQRAFSHSPATDTQSSSRPGSSHRTYSTIVPGASTPLLHLNNTQVPSPLTKVTPAPLYPKEIPPPALKAEQKWTPLLPACPTPYPIAGHQHWYTIRGLKNFDVCSTCMKTLGTSVYRDHFVPSAFRPPTEAVSCAIGRPWVRVAFVRSMKLGNADIELLKELTYRLSAVNSCPGQKVDARRWFHIVDPVSGHGVSDFNICGQCMRTVDTIFPDIVSEDVFGRPANQLSHESTCALRTNSKHFHAIIAEIDKLADYSQKKDLRKSDRQGFIDFIRGIKRHRECSKDALLATRAWHFIPELPEFTICEECFDEVVWPLRDKTIAREVSKTTKPVPIFRSEQQLHASCGISCQLYSDRMRRIFRDAVHRNDPECLRQAAKTRYEMEHRLQEIQKLYAQDQKAGIDRRADIERNIHLWKSYE